MTPEEIYDANMPKCQDWRTFKQMCIASMEQYASQQSAALESENKRLQDDKDDLWTETLLLKSDIGDLRDVLKELVALKDMKERMENGFAALHQSEFDKMKEDYETRKPSAWDAARKLVKQ